MTGIDDPYEQPLSPELECRTDLESVAESTEKVLRFLKAYIVLGRGGYNGRTHRQ
jgi:adenylylsulfate kinase-like enzyme